MSLLLLLLLKGRQAVVARSSRCCRCCCFSRSCRCRCRRSSGSIRFDLTTKFESPTLGTRPEDTRSSSTRTSAAPKVISDDCKWRNRLDRRKSWTCPRRTPWATFEHRQPRHRPEVGKINSNLSFVKDHSYVVSCLQ